MNRNFTTYAFTDSVKTLQTRYKSRKGYERMEESGDRFVLGFNEIAFIQSRDSFFISTVGENGWPYVQHRGGPVGLLKVIDATTLRFADYSGNRQYISSGNVQDNKKACLFLIDYPNQQRLKIWTHAKVEFAEDVPEIAADLEEPGFKAKIERVFTLEVLAFDWNCPKYIPQRYSLDEIRANPDFLNELNANS